MIGINVVEQKTSHSRTSDATWGRRHTYYTLLNSDRDMCGNTGPTLSEGSLKFRLICLLDWLSFIGGTHRVELLNWWWFENKEAQLEVSS